MIKSILSLFMVLSAVFVLSLSAFAQEDGTATINPGSEPESGSGKALVEGNTSSPGIPVYCPTCPHHVRYIRLGDSTNKANDYTALMPPGSKDTPAKADDLAK